MSELPPDQTGAPGEPPGAAGEPAVSVRDVEPEHPIRMLVTDDLQRSRLTVFFRLLLVIPHLIVLLLWFIAVFFVAIVGWFAALIKGQLPDGIHSFLARFMIYSTRVSGYLNLLSDPYPPFGSAGEYAVDLEVDPPQRQNRWTIFFRSILSIPAAILAGVLGQVLQIIAFLGWFVCLVLGRMPKGMRDLGAYCLRYQQQTYCYALLLTQRYPSLSGPQA